MHEGAVVEMARAVSKALSEANTEVAHEGIDDSLHARGLAIHGLSTSSIICTGLPLITATTAPSFTNQANLDRDRSVQSGPEWLGRDWLVESP